MTWIPDDLPEVSVGVAEVAGVDSPGAVMGRRHDRAGGSGLFENPVDVGAARDQLTEAEFSTLRWAGGYCRVLGEFATRVEGEEEPALEREDDDCARRARLLVYEVGCDDALRLQTEAVTIEDERAFEVVDGEGEDIETRLHRSASSFAGSTMRIHATVKRGSEALSDRQLVATGGNGIRPFDPSSGRSHLPLVATGCDPLLNK